MVTGTFHKASSSFSSSIVKALNSRTRARTICDSAPSSRSEAVVRARQERSREHAFLMTEMLVALAILLGALLPLAYSLVSEKRLARAAYQRAVAMELVDGEMEVLVAGEWRAMPVGVHELCGR